MNLRQEIRQRITIVIQNVEMEMIGFKVKGVLEIANRDLIETMSTNLIGIMIINHIEAEIVNEGMTVTGIFCLHNLYQSVMLLSIALLTPVYHTYFSSLLNFLQWDIYITKLVQA